MPYLDSDKSIESSNGAGVPSSRPAESSPVYPTPELIDNLLAQAHESTDADPAPTGKPSDIEPKQKNPHSEQMIKLIDERIALLELVEKIRIQALNTAIKTGLVDEFPQLKLWQYNAKQAGLVTAPPDTDIPKTPENRLSKLAEIQQLMDEIERNDQRRKAITQQIDSLTLSF